METIEIKVTGERISQIIVKLGRGRIETAEGVYFHGAGNEATSEATEEAIAEALETVVI